MIWLIADKLKILGAFNQFNPNVILSFGYFF